MENIILQKTRFLKALMLTMFVGLFAFEASAQTWDATTVPPSPQYANQEATVTYEASTFPAGTTFILWDDVDNNDDIDPDETIFGTATAQGAATDIDFVWPENAVRLKLGGFSGDAVEGEIIPIDNGDVTFVGTNDNFFPFDFDRASARSLTTTAYDVDSSDPVVLTIDVDDFGLDVDNPLEVLFSTDGFATAGTALTEDVSGVEEFDFGGTYTFTLPSGAKSPNTSFRIQQKGTVDYGQGKAWEVNFANIEIGETYTLENPPGVGVNQFTTILTPQLNITDVFNTDNVSFGNMYPGEDVTVEAELQNADLTGLDFAVTITNNDGQWYLLENQNVTVDNGTKEIEVVGDIPADIFYDNINNWDLDIYAYEGSEILFGVSEFYDFTGGLPADFEQIGGFQDGDGLTFDEAGERSVTTVPFNITNTDGLLIFTAARGENVLSPAGTDIIVEYSTDGETYTELASIPLNSLSTAGTKDTLDAWPAGVVSNATQFRFRQEGNNGADLDVFEIQDLEVQNNSNLVSTALIGRASAVTAVNIDAPIITLDNINVGGDGQAFPMEDYEITYSIDNGTFPANTPATAYLQRTGQPDIIIGETTNVNGESIDFTVPPIEAGDYNIYFVTLNEEQYGNVNLAVYDLGLEITEVEYSDPVLVGGDEFTYAGSAITANYTIQGTPGAGAELMMSVYDNNPDVDDWVMIGSTTTLDGAITATLPLEIDYDNNPDVRLSLGSGGVYTEDFSENIFNEYFYSDPFSTELIESTQGTSDDVRPDEFAASGVRSATSVPFDFIYGGSLNNFNLYTTANFTGNFDVKIQGSTDGSTWEDLDEVTFTSIFQTRTFNLNIPIELWSETFQFRIIYNEDEAFAAGENVVKFYNASINRPTFLEVVQDDAPFSLIRPSLAVSDYDKTAFVMGEEVSINYNAVGFPASTEYAAVIEQAGEFYVAGTSAAEDASSITAMMPIAFQNSGNNYSLSVVPFEPATAGGDYKQGETVQIDNEEDFLVISGQDPSWANSYTIFDFDQIGDRELLTKAYDLSGTSSATLNFNFNNTFGYGTIDVNANKNTVPRLEISTDGGATFQLIPVYELEEGEEQIYDDGLLYLQQGYSVDLPAAAFTEATHFRFSQPLNLGEDANRWSVANISLTLNDDNRLPDYQFDDDINGNNPLNPITITVPSLNNYDWMQADLDDAVFNGETFDYSWDIAEGFTMDDVDGFPSETNFTFYLEKGGDYVLDPNTGMPYVLGTANTFGTFEAEVPFFVVNGSYNVRLSASVEIEGEDGPEDYYFHGDEETGVDVGDLDVFLRAAELVYQGDENANIYAGADVEFAIELENDETNNAATGDLFANLLLETNEGDYLLASQQGLGNITATLPTWFNGNANFKLQLTEDEALGNVGDIINDSELENLETNVNNFTSELFSDYVVAVMSGNAQVVQTRKFSKEEFSDIFDVEFDIELFDIVGTTNIRLEYSIDDGENWSFINSWNWSNGYQNEIFDALTAFEEDQMEQNGFILRWIQTSPEGSFQIDDLDPNFGGQSFADNNMENYPANFTIGNATKSNISFDNTSGRRFVTTRTFTAEELENTTAFGFDLTFDQLPGDLTMDQYLVFEYSTDGGSTYTEMQQFPEMDADMTLNGEPFLYAVSTDMKENGVKFRWRQEENKGSISLDNLSFLFGETIPFDYINTSENINQQAFLITSIPEEACLADEITISYEIRGRLGENDFIKVAYSDAFGASNELQQEFMVSGSTGDISFELPSNAVEAGVNNQFFKFELEGNVESQTAGSFNSINGTETEESTEIVAPLNTEASFTVNDPLACETEDVIVSLDNADLQDYFVYEILDAADGTVLGSITRDPEMPESQINIGPISATTDLELRVTAQSSAGTVCNSLITDEETVEVLQNFELYSYSNTDQNWKVVNAGASLNSCNGAGQIFLSTRRLLDNGSITTGGTTLVEWFRDDLNNQVAIGTTQIDDTDMELSGEYFARVTTGSCVYTTERIQIDLADIPDQPSITVVSGDLAACSSAEPVVLEAPAGFAYYRWNNNASLGTRSITVENTGTYTVQVSNVPFGTGCASPASASVSIDRYDVPEFEVGTSTSSSSLIGAGEILDICSDQQRIYFFEDNAYDNDGIVQVIKDGANYTTVEQPTRFIDLDESGVYSFVWNFNSLNVDGCTDSSVEFTLNLNDVADVTPTITATGDLNSCNPENEVTLEGPAGFANYVWRRGNTQLGVFTRTVTVSEAGSYTLRVSNADLNSGCGLSVASSPVVLNNVASDDVFINIAGFGNAVAGQVYDICDNNSTSISVSGVGNGIVTWFQDGAEYAASTNSNGTVNINASGAYFAEVAVGGCVFTTPEVTFNVLETPEDAPVLTATGDLTFCDGQGSVVLEGPEGFEFYQWNGPSLSGNGATSNSNSIEVTANGTYTLQVGNVSPDGAVSCLSPVSNTITVNSRALPGVPNASVFDNSCGDGPVTFVLTNAGGANNVSNNLTYQLINAATDQPSGLAVTGNGSNTTYLTSDVITEQTTFYIQASYADGSGCAVSFPETRTFSATPNNVTLEVQGSQLIARYNSGISEVRWYRDSVLLNNAGTTSFGSTSSSININDAAEYSVEVEYASGCVVTASSADIAGKVLGSRDAMEMKVVSYPNPTLSDVTLNVNSQYMGKHEVIVTSMTGQVMLQSSFEKSSFEAEHAMNVANLEEGIYNVQIRHDGLTQNVRIIKK